MIVPSGFWGCLAGAALYGLIHSLLASHMVKRMAEARYGAAARRGYRLFFTLQSGLLLLPVLALAFLLPDAPLYAIPFPWVLFTLAVQALAVWGVLKGVSQTGALDFLGLRQLTEPKPLIAPSGSSQLVTAGLYRHVRHPLYFFSLLILWLMPVVTWNILALMIGMSLYLVVGTVFEERKLLQEFGAAYEDYRRRTPIFFPGLRIFNRE